LMQVLSLAKFAVDSGRSFELDEGQNDSPEVRQFLRRATANAVVLLKNDHQLLPIQPSNKRISVFGQSASVPVPTGGGSASLSTSYVISPLEAITQAAKEFDATVDYHIGADVYGFLLLANDYLHPAEAGCPVATLEYWLPTNNPSADCFSDVPGVVAQSEADLSTVQESANLFPFDHAFKHVAVSGQGNRVSSVFQQEY
jgi:beta-glucosidase